MEEQKDYFSPDLMSLEQQESKDTYYIPKLQQTIDAGEYASERDIEIAAVKRMAGKNNNAFVRGMRNLEEPLSYAMFDGYLEKKLKEYGMEQESSGWAATKGAVKGVVSAPARFAGYAATNTLPLIAKTATSLYAISGAAGGVESADKFIREANKGIEAWSKEIQRLTGIDDASDVENIVGNALGSVWGSVAIAGAVGGGAVAPMFGVSAAQDTYTRQREAGKSIGESALRGVWHGTGEAALESLQFNRIFGNLAKKSKPIAMLKDLLENAVQEGIQQANEQAANWNIDNRSLVEKLQEIGASVVGGAIASLGGSVGGNILNRNTINEVGDLMKKTGHSEEEINAVKQNLNKIVDTDELEQAANMVAKDELTTIALTYKEQAQAASDELVNQLDGAISRNELVEVPGELSGEKPTDMPPLYQLGDIQVDTQKNPALGMVLYQADKDGKPFETLGQVLEWTQGKLDVAKAKEITTGVNSVYAQTYEQLKALGQDEKLADSNARVRSAMAFSIANTYGVGVEQANKMLGGIVSQKFSEFEGVAPQEVQTVVTEKVEQNIEQNVENAVENQPQQETSLAEAVSESVQEVAKTNEEVAEATQPTDKIEDYGEKLEGAKKDLEYNREKSTVGKQDIEKVMFKAKGDTESRILLAKWLNQQTPEFLAALAKYNHPLFISKTNDYQASLKDLYNKHPEIEEEKPRYKVIWGGEELSPLTLARYGIRPEYEVFIEVGKHDIMEATPENVEAKLGQRGKVDFTFAESTNGNYYLWVKKGSGSYHPLQKFDAKEEMQQYKDSHTQEQLMELYKEKTTVINKEKPIRKRKGTDYRNGKDVTAEDFANTFGFRGVQFGNYEQNEKRQRELNNAYDSLMDLANIVGIPPKAVSLEGKLGIAFGARGSGSAAAHYEPAMKIINITRDSGAGAIGHEWFHALDNYFGGGTKMVTAKGSTSERYAMRQELRRKLVDFLYAIESERDFQSRLKLLGSYWQHKWEVGARVFEQYLVDKMEKEGIINDYLATEKDSIPYLTKEEQARVLPKLDEFFKAMQYEEVDGKYRLYQIAGPGAKTAALDKLEQAKKLDEENKNQQEIRKQTGWFKGEDGKWRFEITDKYATIKQGGLDKISNGRTIELSELLDHKNLYEAYPEFAKGLVFYDNELIGTGTGAYVSGKLGDLTIHLRPGETDKAELKKVLLHEIQHNIQTKEGFARGGSPDEITNEFIGKYNAKIKENQEIVKMVVFDEGYNEYKKLSDEYNKIAEKYNKTEDELSTLKNKHYFENNKEKREKLEKRIEKKEQLSDELFEKEAVVWDKINKKYGKKISEFFERLTTLQKTNPTKYKELSQFIGSITAYKRLYGEMESRNVERRSEMSQQELEETPIEQTQDVPSSEAIVVFEDGTTTSYNGRIAPQTYYQSAYAGSRVDYERPSLEAIGSGEGHQAHGYGLYYALSKDVAEKNYYKRFAKETPKHFVVDGHWVTGKLQELIGQEFMHEETLTAIEKSAEKANNFEELKNLLNENLSKRMKKESGQEKEKISMAIKEIDNINEKDSSIVKPQLHEVDIPESPYLLDEQKMLIDQSDYVQERIQQANKELGLGIEDSGITGDRIYNKISDKLGSDKQASQYLEKLGIKGITYFGRQDGRCFVIFNPDDVKVIQKFYQGEPGTARGAYYNNVTYLFENANESTFVHEQAHAYMDVLRNLANNGNQQAQRDLNAIRNWLGKKQGEAFTQADWERFARGFEMYVREGKAPNEYLGGKDGVFERFKNWLMNIYAGIKSLTVRNEQGKEEPVRINKQIKDFYDEMLGGEDIDSIIDNAQKNEQALATLQNKLKEFSDLQQRLAEERSKLVRDMANNVKPDTTWANVKDWGNNLWESARDLPINVLQSSYARLAAIDPKLGLLVQRAEQSQGARIKRWTDQIKPFYEAFNNLSAEDKAKVQFYLLNQQWGEVEDLLGQENTNAVHNMLKTIYDELIASGVEVGYRENYFPRSVLDYDGLLQEMGLTYPALRKEMEQAIGKDASPEEQAEWLDKHIMGFKGNVSTKGNKYTKERKLDLITDKMAQYYKPSMETLVNYVEGMAKLLSMREAFGKDIEYKGSEESAKDSIGKIIDRMFGDNKLTKKEIDEVRNVLSALYLPNGMGNKFLQAMRQYGYATKLSYSTTVRQFADIGMMMKVNGVLNTLDALFHPDKRITLENLGIDPLGEEFQTSKKDIGGKIANFSTKWKGINWADAIMKNAFMRGNYKDLQKIAKTPDKFHEKYDALFGDETDTLIKDLNNDKVSEPVKVLLFHEISKIQPISRSAMPTAYLSNPNGRVFYMFKTFSLHRAEYMVSELANDFRTGDLKKAGKDIMADVAVIGWEGLVELLISFLKYGWQAFAAKEVLDTFAGAGLGVLGLNKHQALQITRGQIGDFFQEMVGVGTPFDDIGYMIRHYDDNDKLLRAFLPDMILEPLIAGPKPISNKKKKNK